MKKATILLKNNKSVIERADKYTERISKTLEIEILDNLEEQIEKINDEIFDLENMSLETNLNKGIRTLTKEDIEDRFRKIIHLSYRKDLLSAELKSKRATFDFYFKDQSEKSLVEKIGEDVE